MAQKDDLGVQMLLTHLLAALSACLRRQTDSLNLLTQDLRAM